MRRLLEEQKIHQFLMGLDSDVYGTMRSNILALQPLPNLNKVYAFVAWEERQQALVKGMEARDMAEGAAFKSMGTGSTGWDRNPGHNNSTMTSTRHSVQPRCSRCHKPGHRRRIAMNWWDTCLLYTSDAADE